MSQPTSVEDRHGIEHLLARIGRCQARLADLRGGSWQHEVAPPQGDRVRYLFDGIKSYDDLVDDAAILCVWIWSLKDRVNRIWKAKRGVASGENLERRIKESKPLCMVADLAEAEKHGATKDHWSGLFLSFGRPTLKIPQGAIGSIAFSGHDVSLSVKEPNMVVCQLPVVEKSGETIGDFFTIASDAMLAWEKIVQDIESPPVSFVESIAPVTGKVHVGETEAQ